MILKETDILIINNCPAFYKINLYNELAKKCDIHVVFLGVTDQVTISDSFLNDIKFSYEFITLKDIKYRNVFVSLLKIFKILLKIRFKKIIYGGYDTIEFYLMPFITPKNKNTLQFESSIHESKLTGIFVFLKNLIFRRYSIVLTSGSLQSQVIRHLKFRGLVIETQGVGIFRKSKYKNRQTKDLKVNEYKYLYVGRLIQKKNIIFLIDVFNKLNKKLTIVGSGHLEKIAQNIAGNNITFTGFIPNDQMINHYCNNEIFILPSLEEPWGLVVEEALYFSMPVLLSSKIGCQYEMVIKNNSGVIFSPHDESSLINAIKEIESKFEFYQNNAKKINFEERDKSQINAYSKILE